MGRLLEIIAGQTIRRPACFGPRLGDNSLSMPRELLRHRRISSRFPPGCLGNQVARQSDLFSLNWVNRVRVDCVDYSLVDAETGVKKNRRFLISHEKARFYDFI